MNPPFTRDTGHEGRKVGVPNPMFAAFGSKEEEQKEMAKAAQRLLHGTSAHGNAGEASAFFVLADRKLKAGGTLAMVMPLSLMSGEAWEESRQALRKSYDEIILVSIASAGHDDMSFSADTGMAECLVIGRKVGQSSRRSRATFVVLYERPASPMTGSIAALQIRRLREGKLRRLEDGPVGGSLFHFGDDVIGYAMDAALPEKGPWNLARIKDGALAQVAYQMVNEGIIWLPGTTEENAVPVSIVPLAKIGKVGPLHLDIYYNDSKGGIRGPFQIEAVRTKTASTYPVLWAHDAKRERCMEFEADSEGIIRQGKDPDEDKFVQEKASRIW
jgi:hypothetical protein